MRATDESHPIDDLIRRVQPVPAADATEEAAVNVAHSRLQHIIDTPQPSSDGRPSRGPRAWQSFAGAIPIAIACIGALLVAGVAVFALGGHRRPEPQATLHGPVPGVAANALIDKLAVLRRPQTTLDQLPAQLHITTFGQTESPTIIPGLTRLVATPPGAKIYLIVTQPIRGRDAFWSPSLGDQLNIVAVSGAGATMAGAGYPAVDITDPMNVYRAGLQRPNRRRPNIAQRIADAYDVEIVPDGVTRVRWTFATRNGGAGPVITVSVTNNVAITKLTPAHAVPLHTAWYAADGHIVPTSSNARTRALATRDASRQRAAVAAAEKSHAIAAPAILHAFAVFDIDSRSGTRAAGGYVISHPTLPELPLSLLSGLGGNRQLDLRNVRKVVAPSGETLYVVPGASTICLFEVDTTQLPYGRTASGASGSCAGSLALALKEGAGSSSSGGANQGSTVTAVVPRTTHDYKLQTGTHAFRIIHPVDGVVIAHTPFQFG